VKIRGRIFCSDHKMVKDSAGREQGKKLNHNLDFRRSHINIFKDLHGRIPKDIVLERSKVMQLVDDLNNLQKWAERNLTKCKK